MENMKIKNGVALPVLNKITLISELDHRPPWVIHQELDNEAAQVFKLGRSLVTDRPVANEVEFSQYTRVQFQRR